MKFCVNCRHYIPASPETIAARLNPAEYAKCDYRIPGEIDLVLGLPRQQKLVYCVGLRTSRDQDVCGPDAKFFEAKEPIAEVA